MLSNLGNVRQRLGDVDGAIEFYQRSPALRREVGDRVGEGHTSTNIGFLHQQNGRHGQALPFLQQGAAIFRELDDMNDLCTALGNIAAGHRDLGDLDMAHAILAEVLTITTAERDLPGKRTTGWRQSVPRRP